MPFRQISTPRSDPASEVTSVLRGRIQLVVLTLFVRSAILIFNYNMKFPWTEGYNQSVVEHLIVGEGGPSRLYELDSIEADGLFPETITSPCSTDSFNRII